MDTLQQLLAQGEIDMTLFFRALIDADPMDASLAAFDDAFYDPAKREAVAPALRDWLAARAYADVMAHYTWEARAQAILKHVMSHEG